MRLPDGTYRHRMESGRAGERLIVPARAMRKPETWASNLWDRIAAAPPELVQHALQIFVERVDKDGAVRFVPEIDDEDNKCYIRWNHDNAVSLPPGLSLGGIAAARACRRARYVRLDG